MLMNEKEKFYSLYPEMDYDSLFEKVKTDKDFVIAEHRKMWNAIADYSEKCGRCLGKYEYLAFYCKDLVVMLTNGCFLCTYALHNRGNKSMCEHCLLRWPMDTDGLKKKSYVSGSDFLGGPSCCDFSDLRRPAIGLYRSLCLARDEGDALKYARYARIIANLQINEEVYNDEI